MADTSRSINHVVNDLLSKSSPTKGKLDTSTALRYGAILKANILGNDKQEKVNSIVVLAKLLDCLTVSESINNEFPKILDFKLFSTLFSIVSSNMSLDTYKAILKISVTAISGSIFKLTDDTIDKYLPLYEALVEYLDVIDIMTSKLYSQDNKITYYTIKLVNDLILKALKFEYNGIITLAGRMKHVTLFSTVGNLLDVDDKAIADSIETLKVTYYKLNEYLEKTKFDLSIKSHQVMLNNLFIFLEVSLNEYGNPATAEEYTKAGFTDNPRKFVVDNFSILLAMDLKIFLKDPNMSFKKKFHEQLMMSDYNRTFPINEFIRQVTYLWIDVFQSKVKYPHTFDNILSWELMIFYTMRSCLLLWDETKAQLSNPSDIDKILMLIRDNIDLIEHDLGVGEKSIDECLDLTNYLQLRGNQINNIKTQISDQWDPNLKEFNKNLSLEVMDFVCEQRVIQLLKGSWVFTESYGETLMKQSKKSMSSVGATANTTDSPRFYFILISPNRQLLYYKEFIDKPVVKPSYEEMEQYAIRLSDIVDFHSIKVGDQIGEDDKKKNSRLISIKGTISYEKITLLGANNEKLISFYTDTEVNKYVWLDGLKMLKNMIKPGQLSLETEKQLDTLIDIRRNTQLLNLEKVEVGTKDNDDFYNINELVNVAGDFYYN